MARCAVCDYLEGHDPGYAYSPRSRKAVKFNPLHKEYQCEDCYSEILSVENEYNLMDFDFTEASESCSFLFDKPDDILEEAPAVPKLPVE